MTMPQQPAPAPRPWWTIPNAYWTAAEWQAYYAHQSVLLQRRQQQRTSDVIQTLLVFFVWIPLAFLVLGGIMFVALG